MRFSLNSASFQCSLGELAPVAHRAGFRGIELWTQDVNGACPPAEVRKLLDRHDLVVPAFQLLRDYEGAAPDLRGARLAEAERLMAEMQALGAPTLLVCANTAPDSSGDGVQIAKDLRDLAEMAASRSLRIAFEPLAWSRWVNTYEAAIACVDAVGHPAFGLAIDAFHWFWGKTPLAHVRSLPAGKCFEVQLCDAIPNGLPAMKVARHHRLFPGEGVWPVQDLARELVGIGYDGFFNLEVFNDQYKLLPVEALVDRAVGSLNALA